MVDENVPAPAPTRYDYQILLFAVWNTNFFRAFTASALVPAIYIQQFWNTLTYEAKTGAYNFLLDEIRFVLDANLLRDTLEITPIDQTYQFVSPSSGDAIMDFVNQLGYTEVIHFVSRMAVNNLYQPWRAILSMINQYLTGKTSGHDRPRYPEEFVQAIQTFLTDKPEPKGSTQGYPLDSVEVLSRHGPSDAMHNPSQTLKVRKTLDMSQNSLAGDTSIDFQINFFYSIGETVTHWFTLIVLSTLRRSNNKNMLSYKEAKTLFVTIETRFGRNEATKKTQNTLLNQLAVLGVFISQEDLNLKFLKRLPSEWNTHVVVWRNKSDLDTMIIDDLYNNFKIVEQEVKGIAFSYSSSQNMAFISSPSLGSTNEVPTAYGISTASTQSSTTSTKTARNQDSRSWNQDSSRRTVSIEDTTPKAMGAIDEITFDWSYTAEDEVSTNMALIAFLDSHVYTNNTCSKTYLKSYETLKKQYDDLRVEFNKSETSKSLDRLIWSQITDKSRKGVGFKSYNVVSPPPTGLFLPPNIDLSYRGLKEFKQPDFLCYGPKSCETESKNVSKEIPNELKESLDAPLVKDRVSDNKDYSVESLVLVEKKTVVPIVIKDEFVKAKQQEKPVKYAKMYMSQGPRGKQRNWNNLKSQQLEKDTTKEELFIQKEEIELKSTQTSTTAKLTMLKQGNYEMWRLRIKQYFQVQHYDIWDVIKNGNSFKPVAQTTTNDVGISTTLIPGRIITKEKAQKKNNVKARGMLLMRNKSDLDTMSINDLYNNFKIVEQEKTKRKTTLNGSNTTSFDKSKVECYNCHKMGHFSRECRQPRNQDSKSWNQDSSRRTVNVEDTPPKAMVAIDGVGFDWSYMAKDEVLTNMVLMAFSDSGVYTNNTCSKSCLKSYESLKNSYEDLRVEFNKYEFTFVTYKKGLASVEEQLVFYKKNEVIFCEQIVVLKRDLSYRDSEISGLKKSKNASKEILNELKESLDAPLVKDMVSDNKDCSVESPIVVENKIVVPAVTKVEFVKAKQQEKPVRKPIKYAEMYKSQGPRGNQRN
nr:hypothetical protein [Tanacetum cinerariifolium]